MAQTRDHGENMAEELEDLRGQLRDLRANFSTQPAVAPVHVVVQRERRLRSFDGTDPDETAEWCTDCESALRAQNLAGRDAADYVWCHLEGAAKREVGLHSIDVRRDAAAILSVLQNTYWGPHECVAAATTFL